MHLIVLSVVVSGYISAVMSCLSLQLHFSHAGRLPSCSRISGLAAEFLSAEI